MGQQSVELGWSFSGPCIATLLGAGPVCPGPAGRTAAGETVTDNAAADISGEGQGLDSVWLELDNNMCGLVWTPNAALVAERFVGAGWSSRPSSWDAYEVETDWCRMEADPIAGGTLLNGVLDPERFEDLAALLARFGMRFGLELCDQDGELLREVTAIPPLSPQGALRRPPGRLRARLAFWSRRGDRWAPIPVRAMPPGWERVWCRPGLPRLRPELTAA
ncbi:hypothetical protein [Streptomyces sp. NPDC054838]